MSIDLVRQILVFSSGREEKAEEIISLKKEQSFSIIDSGWVKIESTNDINAIRIREA